MNLQTHIPPALWDAVAGAYKTENFSHAILESIYFLSSMMRDRSGVDADGVSLVGQALGGESPRLKLSALQTESERDMQRGYEQILRGLYTGIRNPRSHESSVDEKETADAIIHFVGHIAVLLSSSREAFTIDAFMERVLDAEFVETERYAELIVGEVPKLRVGDATIALYRARESVDLRRRGYLVDSLLSSMSPPQLATYLDIVSEDLRNTNENLAIRTATQMLSPQIWPDLSEVTRLRIENKVVKLISAGSVTEAGKTEQGLATWFNDFIKYFTLRDEATLALIRRLESSDASARRYVGKWFLSQLPEAIASEPRARRCINSMVTAIKGGDEGLGASLQYVIGSYPSEWQTALAEGLKELTDPENPALRFADGTPFLKADAGDSFDDDIPF